MNTQIVGVSSDPPAVSGLFKEKGNLNFPLLCDSSRVTAKEYEVAFTEHNVMGTGLFLIDKEGIIRFGKVSRPDELFPSDTVERLISFLKSSVAK